MENCRILKTVTLLVIFYSIFTCVKCQPQKHINGTRRVFKHELEVTALRKFRGMVSKYLYKDYMKENVYLLRWLRDQHLDLDSAREKLLKSLRWRKVNDVDSILKEDFSEILKNCPYDLDGRDKQGKPFLTAALGNCYLRKIMLSGKVDKLNRAIIHLLEKMCEIRRQIQNETQSEESVNWMTIADFSGLSMREHMCPNCVPFFLTMMTVYLNNYPQLFKDIYIINMSRLTVTLIEFLQNFAPETQEESLYAFGYDKPEWQAELLKRINPDQLPPQFGGTKGRS